MVAEGVLFIEARKRVLKFSPFAEETAEKVVRRHVGHVSNVPGLTRFNLPACQISLSWHVGNVPHDFFSSLRRAPG